MQQRERVGIPTAGDAAGMVWVEDRNAVEQVGGLVRGATSKTDPAWGFRPQRYLAATQRFEDVRLDPLRVVPYRGGGDLAVGECGGGAHVEAANDDRSANIDRVEVDGVGKEPDVDLQPTVLRHEGTEGSPGVADEMNGDFVLAGWHLPQDVPPRLVGGDGTIQVGQRDRCADNVLGGLRVPDPADDRPLHQLGNKQDLCRA